MAVSQQDERQREPGKPEPPPQRELVEAAMRDGFLVIPLRTELQRTRAHNAKVLVIINAVSLITGDDEGLDARAIKLSKIWEALEPYTEGGPGKVVVTIYLRKTPRPSLR